MIQALTLKRWWRAQIEHRACTTPSPYHTPLTDTLRFPENPLMWDITAFSVTLSPIHLRNLTFCQSCPYSASEWPDFNWLKDFHLLLINKNKGTYFTWLYPPVLLTFVILHTSGKHRFLKVITERNISGIFNIHFVRSVLSKWLISSPGWDAYYVHIHMRKLTWIMLLNSSELQIANLESSLGTSLVIYWWRTCLAIRGPKFDPGRNKNPMPRRN